MNPATTPLIECKQLEKWYSGVYALKKVDFVLYPNEVVGLVGDNGAGKSTLIQILSGAHLPDGGEVLVEGQTVRIHSPKVAMRLGIETIYQYTAMVHTMSIARNIFIGREPMRWQVGGVGMLNQSKMRQEAVTAIRDVDLELRSPDALVGELSGGQRQGVAIARAMHFKSKVLILDEPTNHLSVKETNKVLRFVSELKQQQVSGIFISHNIHHVFEVCDRIVVMARGEKIAELVKDDTDIDTIHRLLDA
ncbi:MAG: ATP-binding cassette domain-containing protein [Deinococcota bacterium]